MTESEKKPPLKFRTHAPVVVTIGGREIALRIKRQDVGEFAAFDRLWWRAINGEADRLILVRRPGEEMERQPRVVLSAQKVDEYRAAVEIIAVAGADAETVPKLIAMVLAILNDVEPREDFVIPDDEIKRRRLLEMTDQERANYERVKKADSEAFETAVRDGLHKFVRVVPGQIALEDEDGQTVDVTTGDQLAQCIGGEPGLLFRLLLEIRRANTLGDDEKNASGSRSTSSSSSNERDLKVTGAPPAVAATADLPGSVMTADATAPATSLSGSTAT